MSLQEPVFEFPLLLERADTDGRKGGRMRLLHAQLRAAILDRRLRAGAELPSTRRVAAAYGIARNTVIAAYDLLVAEGYLVPRGGANAVVADLAVRRPAPRRASAHAPEPAQINPVWTLPALQPAPPRLLPARSFRLGTPEHAQFPHAAWQRLLARAQRAVAKSHFSYAPAQGRTDLREAIADHVAFTRAVACTGDDVIVTSGAQQAFDLIARLLVRPGQTRVAVEEPGYPPTRAAFLAAGAELVPVPVDDAGLCVELIPRDVRIISVTPSHQSPTGAALSLRRRQALLEFARAHGAVIVEDDYDGEFRFGPRPLDALQTLDRDLRVFYVGTFSKSLFPALRKGFIVAPAWARDGLVAVKRVVDSHCDALSQATLAAFIREGHLARHVRRMRPIYAARRTALLAGIDDLLGDWLQPIPSEAGLHLAARIRDARRAPSILAAMADCLPGAQSIADYSLEPPAAPAVVCGYGVIDVEAIRPALLRWQRALQRDSRRVASRR